MSAAASPVADAAADASASVLERVVKLPVVEVALIKSAGVYDWVKKSHDLVNWTLTTAETTAKRAYDAAMPVVQNVLPMATVDATLCKGLDMVEAKFPCIKEEPDQLYEDAKTYSLDCVEAARAYSTGKVRAIADLSWQQANKVLATRYGDMAFNSIGMSATIAEQYLDHFFPPTAEEAATDPPLKDDQLDDRVMRTVHTVGRLSSLAGRRIYHRLSSQVRSLTADNAHEYVRSLVALLTLDKYVTAMRAVEDASIPETDDSESKQDK